MSPVKVAMMEKRIVDKSVEWRDVLGFHQSQRWVQASLDVISCLMMRHICCSQYVYRSKNLVIGSSRPVQVAGVMHHGVNSTSEGTRQAYAINHAGESKKRSCLDIKMVFAGVQPSEGPYSELLRSELAFHSEISSERSGARACRLGSFAFLGHLHQ